MLIVTLKENEKVLIANDISVMVVEIRGNQIRLGIEARAGLLILREKLAGKAKGYAQAQLSEEYQNNFIYHGVAER
jgi:carbon storage regulator